MMFPELRRYRIMNRTTRGWWEGEAESAQEACIKAGWPMGECWVRQYSSKGAGGWKTPDELKVKARSEER